MGAGNLRFMLRKREDKYGQCTKRLIIVRLYTALAAMSGRNEHSVPFNLGQECDLPWSNGLDRVSQDRTDYAGNNPLRMPPIVIPHSKGVE